jgi:excisionase family DNA binding protein
VSTPHQQPSRPALVKIAEAQQQLRLGETKLREFVKSGHLELVKLGSASRITQRSIDRFIEALTANSKSEAA